MANKKPVVLCHFGRPDSGKSYEMEVQATKAYDNKMRETIFVFNSGRDTDWQGYIEIELSSIKKTEELQFTYKKNVYNFSESFMKLFKGKKVKARRTKKALTKSLLFIEMSERGYAGTFFIVDDAIAIIGSKLTFGQNACFFGAKHGDVWLGIVFHEPNQFPIGAWGALTMAKFFISNVKPDTKKASRIPHFNKMMSFYNILRAAPQYSFCGLDMNTGDAIYTPYKKVSKRKPKSKSKPKTK